jgi:hypothetical protein
MQSKRPSPNQGAIAVAEEAATENEVFWLLSAQNSKVGGFTQKLRFRCITSSRAGRLGKCALAP